MPAHRQREWRRMRIAVTGGARRRWQETVQMESAEMCAASNQLRHPSALARIRACEQATRRVEPAVPGTKLPEAGSGSFQPTAGDGTDAWS